MSAGGRRPAIAADYCPSAREARDLQSGQVSLLVVPGPVRQRVILAIRDDRGEVGALLLDRKAAGILATELRRAVVDLQAPDRAEYVAQGATVLHRRSCEHLAPTATARYFETREDGLAVGLRPCKTCRP